ncbi:MgtC/SapB family protein [Thiohalocapsa sp. ML1]|jgi:putative Mg2+ transporter-C (MgtC) family protein|uniref:MgtC/SapB family protein n=1 Tax=Thiohalocapsa sp. ML1 TaxID=1431688 RepID=UPI000AC372D1|nr:MgtC/SapB family protein [Thiohalocapsa sp. ML1]
MDSLLIASHQPPAELALRLGAAAGLGLLLGLERELRGKAAGLRTHMLVCLGSAAFLLVALHIVHAESGDLGTSVDPSRVIQGVIGGVGFLGAGSIIQSRGSVHGLTTGAGIWIAGAVGLACGFGDFVLAGLVTGFAVVIVVVLGFIERWLL